MERRTLLVVGIVAFFPVCGCKQARQLSLLNQARSKYYNLHTEHVTAFDCDVQPQWEQFLRQVRSNATAQTPWDAYLKQAHLHFRQPVNGHSEVSWIEAAPPPPGKEVQAATMKKAFHDMVEGFLAAITPNLTGTLLPSIPLHTMDPTPDGYQLTEDDLQGRHSLVSLDKHFTVKHISMHSTTMQVESDMSFQPSAKGLLLARMDTLSQEPPTAPPIHSSFETDYASVDGVLLPSSFTAITSKGVRIPMLFNNCQVTR